MPFFFIITWKENKKTKKIYLANVTFNPQENVTWAERKWAGAL